MAKAAAKPAVENTAICRRPGKGAAPKARYAKALVIQARSKPGNNCRINRIALVSLLPWRLEK